MCFGSGALAEYAVTGSRPSATATSMLAVGREVVGAAVLVDLPVHEGRAAVDLLHPVHADVAAAVARVVRDHRGERDERRRVAGPAALDRAAGRGRRRRRSSTTSWQAPRATVFGRESAIDFSFFRPRTFSTSPCGGCISSTSSSCAATSSSRSTPKARHMRRSVPNWLISSGCRAPFGFSNRSAGPPALTVRSTISVISRSGSTSAATRTSSPSRSSSAIQSRRSAAGPSRSVYGRERILDRASSEQLRPRPVASTHAPNSCGCPADTGRPSSPRYCSQRRQCAAHLLVRLAPQSVAPPLGVASAPGAA